MPEEEDSPHAPNIGTLRAVINSLREKRGTFLTAEGPGPSPPEEKR
jgi:hypothetical protein